MKEEFEMLNTVVLHFVDGTILKGTTDDFFPNKDMFHLKAKGGGEIREVRLTNLKAVYFVKSFEGDPLYQDKADQERAGFGKKIKVIFRDGETQVGYTQGFTPDRNGFFVFPADPDSNNDRVFVVNASTEKVHFM
jgi:hypothetical protein